MPMYRHHVTNQMVLPDGIASVQLHPLQFVGGLIELAILFLILAVVAGVLGRAVSPASVGKSPRGT